MPEFVKKMLLGTYKEVPYEDDASHIIYSLDEFYDQQQQNRSDLSLAKEKCKEKLQSIYEKKMKEQEYDLVETKALYTVLQGNYQDLKEENSSMKEEIDLLDDKIESLEAENVKLTEEAERNIYLNQNFIRIAKERANSQNGKSKTDSGYSVIYSGQYYDPDFYAPVWRTYIRTPYDAGIPIDNIRQTIRQDLIYDVLGKIGIEVLQKFQKNGVYENWEDKDGRLMNAAYKILYKSNFREGFWEIELFHITPVFVPHELRPSLKTSSNTKGRRDNHDKKSNNKH